MLFDFVFGFCFPFLSFPSIRLGRRARERKGREGTRGSRVREAECEEASSASSFPVVLSQWRRAFRRRRQLQRGGAGRERERGRVSHGGEGEREREGRKNLGDGRKEEGNITFRFVARRGGGDGGFVAIATYPSIYLSIRLSIYPRSYVVGCS